MALREELDFKNLTEEQKKFIKDIDKQLLEGIEDIENNRIYNISEIKDFLKKDNKYLINSKKIPGVLV